MAFLFCASHILKPCSEHPIPQQDYAVGDRVKVNLHTGRIVDAMVKAVIERTDRKRLEVDFGKDETALIHLWQEVERIR
jgi:hypothetical protein